ncbi:MAG: helix-turn-helix domain-containing protein [Phototrophicaceae bacterium]|jgi:excisionase family DNA binding protein
MTNQTEWVSLRHAAEILGVHPATVRNWADRGDVGSRRTPGGHRRFKRADLLKMAESTPIEASITGEVQIILQNALGQARMQVGQGSLESLAWYSAMSEATRQGLREQGRTVLTAMRAYLNSAGDDAHLAEAVRLGKEYARYLHQDGMSLPQAMRGFFYFSDVILQSILSLSEVAAPREPSEWARVLRRVNDFSHTMLLSLVEYYQED